MQFSVSLDHAFLANAVFKQRALCISDIWSVPPQESKNHCTAKPQWLILKIPNFHNCCNRHITCFVKTDCYGVTHLRAVSLDAGRTGNPKCCPSCFVVCSTQVRRHFPKLEKPFTFPLPFQPHSLLSGLS